MNIRRFNVELREMLLGLISDGFRQKDVTSMTFGANRQDQLTGFLNGRDISGRPLGRIFDVFGFDIHLVPVPKKNYKEKEMLDSMAQNALESIQISMVDYLDGVVRQKRRKKNIIFFVDSIIEKINREK